MLTERKRERGREDKKRVCVERWREDREREREREKEKERER